MLFPGIGPGRRDLQRGGAGSALAAVPATLIPRGSSRGPRIPPGRITEYPSEAAFNNRQRLTRCRNVCTEQSAGGSGSFLQLAQLRIPDPAGGTSFPLSLLSLSFLANPARWRSTELSGEASIKYSLTLITLDYFGLLLLLFHRTQEHNHFLMQGKR
jgi:hypothetical protein